MPTLWTSGALHEWHAALARYGAVVEAQGVARLPELDSWYRETLPTTIAGRPQPFLTLAELVRLTEWKMARGVWRAPNLVLVRGNDARLVEETTRTAIALVPDPTRPVTRLATLAGVGPATASAVLAAVAPDVYPFFDERVAAEVPDLGKVAWTLGFYAKYAIRLHERAAELGGGFTPVMVERALWTHSELRRRAL